MVIGVDLRSNSILKRQIKERNNVSDSNTTALEGL